MRLTSKNKRLDRGGKHNDRNFDLNDALHIDAEKSSGNKYYTYNGDATLTFEELEKQYYAEHFLTHIEKQNARNDMAGHSERNMTLDQYYRHDFSRPEDRILQIGDKDKHATPEELWDCALEYATKFNDHFGKYCKILDMALHVDEATPHVHIRRVWVAEDKDGDRCVGQSKALKAMGMQNPDATKLMNGKKEFSRLDRRMFYEICREHGIDVEINNPVKRRELTLPEYKKAVIELERLRKENAKLKEENVEIQEEMERQKKIADELKRTAEILAEQMLQVIRNNDYIADKHYKELKEAERKRGEERYQIIQAIYKREIKSLYSQNQVCEFIRASGLQAKYDDYLKKKTELENSNIR